MAVAAAVGLVLMLGTGEEEATKHNTGPRDELDFSAHTLEDGHTPPSMVSVTMQQAGKRNSKRGKSFTTVRY